MWGYDEWPEVEKSEMDLLLEEYREKCVDLICGSVNSEISAILDNNSRLIKENEKLRNLLDNNVGNLKKFIDTIKIVK